MPNHVGLATAGHARTRFPGAAGNMKSQLGTELLLALAVPYLILAALRQG